MKRNKLHPEKFHNLDKRSQWFMIKSQIKVKKKLKRAARTSNEIHGLLMNMPFPIRSWLGCVANGMSGDNKDIEELFKVSAEEVNKRIEALNSVLKVLRRIFYKGLDDELRKKINE